MSDKTAKSASEHNACPAKNSKYNETTAQQSADNKQAGDNASARQIFQGDAYPIKTFNLDGDIKNSIQTYVSIKRQKLQYEYICQVQKNVWLATFMYLLFIACASWLAAHSGIVLKCVLTAAAVAIMTGALLYVCQVYHYIIHLLTDNCGNEKCISKQYKWIRRLYIVIFIALTFMYAVIALLY